MMSSTTASYPSCRAASSPVSPSAARSTTYPSAARPRCSARASRGSSSTTSTRMGSRVARRGPGSQQVSGGAQVDRRTMVAHARRYEEAFSMSVMASRPVLRWALPAGIVTVVLAGGAIATALRASADVRLPPRSAAQLLVDLQTARLDGVSGTVVERADLGLPGLPPGLSLGGGGAADVTSLISGTHTLRVWYSGTDKARVALLSATGESDIIVNRGEAWVWNSRDNSAVHYKDGDARPGPAKSHVPPADLASDLPKTTQEVADRVLAALDPTTAVRIDSNALVAGHKAYQLVLEPKTTASLIGEVRIAIAGEAHVPTRAEVFAKADMGKAAFEIGFTQVSFQRPDDSVFNFNPPPGAKVTEAEQAAKDAAANTPDRPEAAPKSVVLGQGWTAVLVARLPETTPAGKAQDNGAQAGIQGFLDRLPQVHGAFGSGRVLTSKLFTALLLDDGRVLIGAVSQERLVAAASDPAAALK